MKAIERLKNIYVPEAAPEVKKLTFTHAASGIKNKRKGYGVIAADATGTSRRERITIEPVQYSNGDKWLIYGDYVRYFMGMNLFYAKNLKEVCKRLETQK